MKSDSKRKADKWERQNEDLRELSNLNQELKLKINCIENENFMRKEELKMTKKKLKDFVDTHECEIKLA
jgi:hypothetical protein